MPDVRCIVPVGPGSRMQLDENLVCGRFLRRVNRFVAEVQFEGRTEPVHVPNSGRLIQLLIPGNPVVLADRRSPTRKTDWDLILAALPGETSPRWSLVDSRRPMDILFRALREGRLPEFGGLTRVDREVSVGGSRFDYRLGRDADPEVCWVELKSVTLTVPTPWGPEARFPDAPTRRGTRHLRELSALAGSGSRCAVVFAVCRPDAHSVSVNAEVDPAFASALWEAAMAGVEIYGLKITSDPRKGCWLEGRLPVRIPSSCGNHF